MENISRILFAFLSFIIPLVGVALYFLYSKKQDAKLFGMISVIGVIVYIGIGLGFI